MTRYYFKHAFYIIYSGSPFAKFVWYTEGVLKWVKKNNKLISNINNFNGNKLTGWTFQEDFKSRNCPMWLSYSDVSLKVPVRLLMESRRILLLSFFKCNNTYCSPAREFMPETFWIGTSYVLCKKKGAKVCTRMALPPCRSQRFRTHLWQIQKATMGTPTAVKKISDLCKCIAVYNWLLKLDLESSTSKLQAPWSWNKC